MNVDFGKLTEEETAELAVEALGELTLDRRVQAVLKAFNEDERDELAEWIGQDKKPVEGTPSASGTDSTG